MNPVAFLERLPLQPRERRLLGFALLGLLLALVLGVPVGLELYVHGRRTELEETRAALAQLQAARAQVRERQAKKDAITARYARKAPPLAGFLEELAGREKLAVADAVDRPEVPHGKRYTERTTVAHFKKVGMGPVVRFLEAIEKSGYPVTLSRFNLRKRSGEVDSFDLEIGVSAFDRAEAAPKANKEPSAP